MIARLSLILRRTVACSALLAALVAIAVLAPRDAAIAAFPAAGTDVIPVTGQVSVSSRIGVETIPLTGSATIQRQPTHLESGFEVQTAEITALSLTGNSVTGPVSVGESPTLTSNGELRALQTSSSFPASSFFNVYATITAPASPGGSMVLINTTPLHMVPTAPLNSWPPYSATYAASPSPCVALTPVFPKTICITSASFTLSGGVGGIAELTSVGAPGDSSGSTAWEITLGAAGALAALGAAWAARRLLRR